MTQKHRNKNEKTSIKYIYKWWDTRLSLCLYGEVMKIIKSAENFNPIQDGPFHCCSRIGGRGGGKKAPLPKICHTNVLYNDEIWHSLQL